MIPDDEEDDSFEAQEVFCPECDEDYVLAWSDKHEGMYIVCGCGRAENAEDFIERFYEEMTDTHDDKMFQ